MNSTIVQLSCRRWLVAVAVTGISGAFQLSNAAESPLANTNVPSIALDALVTEVLEHNPELNFYRAEIAAAKGERRTAATRANPELAATVGDKRVTDGSLAGGGMASNGSSNNRILVVGDDEMMSKMLRVALANEGFEVIHAQSGEEGYESAVRVSPRAIIADVLLPGVDGLALCRMFNKAISEQGLPTRLSTDHDPLFQFCRWKANLRILDVERVQTANSSNGISFMVMNGS